MSLYGTGTETGAARYLLESSLVDGYLLEDGTGVLLLEIVAPILNAYNKILYTSEPPTPNAWNQVKQDAGTGWKKLLYV